METVLGARQGRPFDKRERLFMSWVGPVLRWTVQIIGSLAYVIGVTVLLVGDVYLGAQVLPGMFAHADPTTKRLLPWVISIATSAAQMGLWALLLKWKREGSFGGGVRILGFVAAGMVSLIDTLIDALYAQPLVLGSSPIVFPPAELSTFGGFHLAFWLIFILFGLVSLCGEPVALYLLFAFDQHEGEREPAGQ